MQKCQFSLAYLQAVAAVAGIKILRTDVDDDGIDAGLERSGGCAPKLDIQLKCTAALPAPDADHRFDLKVATYDQLRRPTLAPRLLVVLYVPDAPVEWLRIDPAQAIIRHHARWISLLGRPAVANLETVGVNLAGNNLFTPEIVVDQMNQVQNGFEAA